MADAWDDDDFEPDIVIKPATKKEWDEEDTAIARTKDGDEGSTTAGGLLPIVDICTLSFPAASSTGKAGGAKAKSKPSAATKARSLINRELTAKEQEELAMEQEMEMFAETTLGQTTNGEAGGPATKLADLETVVEFREFAERLKELLVTRKNSAHFVDFANHLCVGIAENLESKHIRNLSTLLKTVADNVKAEEEKAKTKGKSTKPQKLATAKKTSAHARDLLEDLVDEGDGYDDDDDFM